MTVVDRVSLALAMVEPESATMVAHALEEASILGLSAQDVADKLQAVHPATEAIRGARRMAREHTSRRL